MIKRFVVLLASLLAMAAVCVGVAGSADAATGSYKASCFGYTGTFRAETNLPTVLHVTWANGTQNCYGISPGRHIFDTSPGHPWYEIPGGGLADGLRGAYGDGNTKGYIVHVDASNHDFCQAWHAGSGWEGSWPRC